MNLTPSFVRHAFLPLNFVFLFSFFAIAEDRIDAKAALDLVGYPEEMAMGVAEIEGVADYLFLFDAWARDGWKKTFRRNFPVDGILREIEAKVAREVSSAHLAEIAVFYRTPLGARVLAAQRLGVESPAMTPDPAEAVSRLAEIEAAEPARLRA